MTSLRTTVLAALIWCQPSFAEVIFVAPAMVVRDNNGDPIGPVVGFDGNFGVPVIRILDDVTDAETPIPVFITVRGNSWLETTGRTIFSSSDCTGQAYHERVAIPTVGMPSLTGGVYHSIARRGAGGNLELFASCGSRKWKPVDSIA